jgi:hypothetical protein
MESKLYQQKQVTVTCNTGLSKALFRKCISAFQNDPKTIRSLSVFLQGKFLNKEGGLFPSIPVKCLIHYVEEFHPLQFVATTKAADSLSV